jgi:hypothetical protein
MTDTGIRGETERIRAQHTNRTASPGRHIDGSLDYESRERNGRRNMVGESGMVPGTWLERADWSQGHGWRERNGPRDIVGESGMVPGTWLERAEWSQGHGWKEQNGPRDMVGESRMVPGTWLERAEWSRGNGWKERNGPRDMVGKSGMVPWLKRAADSGRATRIAANPLNTKPTVLHSESDQ